MVGASENQAYTFLIAVANLKKESITQETLELLQPYLSAPDLTVESGKKIAGGLAMLFDFHRKFS